jgi:hypothetical protein
MAKKIARFLCRLCGGQYDCEKVADECEKKCKEKLDRKKSQHKTLRFSTVMNGEFECAGCGDVFFIEMELDRYRQPSCPEEPLTCPHCDRVGDVDEDEFNDKFRN